MLRKARLSDVDAIFSLISYYAKRGLLLPITEGLICEYIRDFCVFVDEDEVVGCAALRIFTKDLAEVRSVAVKPGWERKGIGKKLVEFCLDEAKKLELQRVFVLTKAVDFFKACGFVQIDKKSLPQKVWRDCMGCPKFPECDEVAMIKILGG